MNKIERITAVLAGRQPDRAPVSFWYHFGPEAIYGPRAVAAHVRHVETYDLDFLKIMDDNRYPRRATPSGVVAGIDDLDKLKVLKGDEDTFGRQLELIGQLARRFAGQLRMPTTVFNSWSTLRRLTVPDDGQHGRPDLAGTANPRDATMSQFLHLAPAALARALDVIAESLANFVRHALAAGADGVFLSVRDDWVDTQENGPGTYDRLVQPGDLKILAAAEHGAFNILHVCGKALDFQRFAGYPVAVINWADRQAGPAIADVAGRLRPAICAGLDHLGTMVSGSAEDCVREMADAVRQAGGRPIMIAPGCTFDPAAVPQENLHAIRRGAEGLRWDG
ncbi:MAG TPA: uroporphyrinogen decarboxylase family protein [Gemmataceae bacterium]|jgi:uroporphyrinogen decarboxylase|nr:uroporphyrinogen decarboxylase family protein [Gemmataceae bacterium]